MKEWICKKGSLGAFLLAALLGLSACAAPAATMDTAMPAASAQGTGAVSTEATTVPSAGGYQKITAQEAKQVMDENPDAIIIDVREQSEYDAGHIPNATLLPVGQLEALAAEALPDRNALLLVYCRSGRRSKAGAEALVSLGYTDVRDFGGIIDWPYDVVAD
jgi:rhodanese-related sulfurtransferase